MSILDETYRGHTNKDKDQAQDQDQGEYINQSGKNQTKGAGEKQSGKPSSSSPSSSLHDQQRYSHPPSPNLKTIHQRRNEYRQEESDWITRNRDRNRNSNRSGSSSSGVLRIVTIGNSDDNNNNNRDHASNSSNLDISPTSPPPPTPPPKSPIPPTPPKSPKSSKTSRYSIPIKQSGNSLPLSHTSSTGGTESHQATLGDQVGSSSASGLELGSGLGESSSSVSNSASGFVVLGRVVGSTRGSSGVEGNRHIEDNSKIDPREEGEGNGTGSVYSMDSSNRFSKPSQHPGIQLDFSPDLDTSPPTPTTHPTPTNSTFPSWSYSPPPSSPALSSTRVDSERSEPSSSFSVSEQGIESGLVTTKGGKDKEGRLTQTQRQGFSPTRNRNGIGSKVKLHKMHQSHSLNNDIRSTSTTSSSCSSSGHLPQSPIPPLAPTPDSTPPTHGSHLATTPTSSSHPHVSSTTPSHPHSNQHHETPRLRSRAGSRSNTQHKVGDSMSLAQELGVSGEEEVGNETFGVVVGDGGSSLEGEGNGSEGKGNSGINGGGGTVGGGGRGGRNRSATVGNERGRRFADGIASGSGVTSGDGDMVDSEASAKGTNGGRSLSRNKFGAMILGQRRGSNAGHGMRSISDEMETSGIRESGSGTAPLRLRRSSPQRSFVSPTGNVLDHSISTRTGMIQGTGELPVYIPYSNPNLPPNSNAPTHSPFSTPSSESSPVARSAIPNLLQTPYPLVRSASDQEVSSPTYLTSPIQNHQAALPNTAVPSRRSSLPVAELKEVASTPAHPRKDKRTGDYGPGLSMQAAGPSTDLAGTSREENRQPLSHTASLSSKPKRRETSIGQDERLRATGSLTNLNAGTGRGSTARRPSAGSDLDSGKAGMITSKDVTLISTMATQLPGRSSSRRHSSRHQPSQSAHPSPDTTLDDAAESSTAGHDSTSRHEPVPYSAGGSRSDKTARSSRTRAQDGQETERYSMRMARDVVKRDRSRERDTRDRKGKRAASKKGYVYVMDELPKFPTTGMHWSVMPYHGSPPSRQVRSHTATLVGNKIYYIGGMDPHGCWNGIAVFNTESQGWSVLKPDGDPLPAMRAHTTTLVGTRLYIFGGGDGIVFYNEVWALDLESTEWYKPYIRTPRTEWPPTRRAHTTVLYKTYLVVFGGGNGNAGLNDVWALDVNDPWGLSWRKWETSGDVPAKKGYHTANLVGSKMIVIGGSDGTDSISDVHVLDLETLEWTLVDTGIQYPRLSHTSTQVGAYLAVFGGFDGKKYTDSVLLLNLVTLVWESKAIYGNIPTARGYHTALIHDSRLIIQGGYNGTAYFGDMHILELSGNGYLPQVTGFKVDEKSRRLVKRGEENVKAYKI